MIHLIHSKPKPQGTVIITDLNNNTQEFDTQCCVHCRKHWIFKKGSGRKRGFCIKCMGPTCGCKECDNCIPYEKVIEKIGH